MAGTAVQQGVRSRHGRHARGRWPVRLAAAVAAVGVLAALAVVHGSGAFWRSSVQVGGATITSGDLILRVGDAGSEVQAYPFAALGGTNLRPGSVLQAPLTLRNGGTTAGQVALTSTAVSGATAPLALTVTRVASAAACPTAASPDGTVLYGPAPLAAATTSPRPLPAGSTETWCFRAALTSTDTRDSGVTGSATFTFRIDQV